MPPRSLLRAATILGIATALGFGAGAAQSAQSTTCTYVRCALRVEEHGIGVAPQLVQGLEARPVTTIGLFAPRIPLFESSPDSVRQPYQAFRRNLNRSGVLWIVGVTTALSSALFVKQAAQGHPGTLIGVLGAGTGISLVALVERARGKNNLDLAVQRYNEALPNTP